ncbi:MAG: hypothetical protein ACREAW_01565 [Nitrososphaera sp.]
MKPKIVCADAWIWGGPEEQDAMVVQAKLIVNKTQYTEFLNVVCRGNAKLAEEMFSSYVSNMLEYNTGEIDDPCAHAKLLAAVSKYYQDKGANT